MSQSVADDSERYIARGIAHVKLSTPPRAPITISFVLMPRFTMLAFTSAIEPLRVANQLTERLLFKWRIHSETGAPITCSNGVPLVPDAPLSEAPASDYVLVCGGVEPDAGCSTELTDWIRKQWRHGGTVGGLCTGAYALARAGILNNRRFTLHWENIPNFTEKYPDLAPERRIFCIDDRIVTCAGGVASAELALKLIEDYYGAELSQAVMNMCLLGQIRRGEDEQLSSLSVRLGTRNDHLIRAVAYIEAHVEDEVDLGECASHLGISRRQLERLFQRYLDTTPLQYLNKVRLQHARSLLTETNLSVMQVAVACGFSSSSYFSKVFRTQYGVSPYKFSLTRKRAGE
ncbi:GlxA family transcriptional regulator [Paracoccus sp. MKU1]|uniref:GlxA family transcriptional regulator n=1 Tax=Paracoccus sp. MKU1 TaxID=1745182 RepID=UPI0007193A89|nr:GlxA family transcriptional regulator [Paracoccus sp. MKU1]KRW95263.1 AraC family transcriptional regulator [Paracoccus sp. MKU1]